MGHIELKQVTVTAARIFPNPQGGGTFYEPEVALTADVGAYGDHGVIVKRLQAVAEELIEEHCEQFLKALEQRQDQKEAQAPAAETVPFRETPDDLPPAAA